MNAVSIREKGTEDLMLPKLLKVRDFAQQWEISLPQAYEAVKQMPPGVRVHCGKRIRLNVQALIAWYGNGGTSTR